MPEELPLLVSKHLRSGSYRSIYIQCVSASACQGHLRFPLSTAPILSLILTIKCPPTPMSSHSPSRSSSYRSGRRSRIRSTSPYDGSEYTTADASIRLEEWTNYSPTPGEVPLRSLFLSSDRPLADQNPSRASLHTQAIATEQEAAKDPNIKVGRSHRLVVVVSKDGTFYLGWSQGQQQQG